MLNPLPDFSALAEQLCRIEHKLDLLIQYFAERDGEFKLEPIVNGTHIDPITQEKVQYYMDLFKRHVIRKTSDGTGLLAPSSILFAPHNPITGNSGNGGESNSDV